MQQGRRRLLWTGQSNDNTTRRACCRCSGRLQHWFLYLRRLHRLHDDRLLCLRLSRSTRRQGDRPLHWRSSRRRRLLLSTHRDRTGRSRCRGGRIDARTGTLPVFTAGRRRRGHRDRRLGGTLSRLDRCRVTGGWRWTTSTSSAAHHRVQWRRFSYVRAALIQAQRLHLLAQLLLGLRPILDYDRLSTATVGERESVQHDAAGGRGGRGGYGRRAPRWTLARRNASSR